MVEETGETSPSDEKENKKRVCLEYKGWLDYALYVQMKAHINSTN